MAVTVIKNYTRRVVSPKKSKTGLILGIALLVGGGIGVLAWYLYNKNKPTSNDGSSSETSNETTKDETSKDESKKDAITQIGVTAKDGTPIIVKEDKKAKETKKDLPLSFPKDTVLVPRAPLKSSPALDMGAKNIGNYNRAIYVSDLSDKYIIGKVDKPKGAYFETVNAYLLKKDWIKK
jgi:hypothetical protein